jgi:PAS domain S-box-containing protein
VGTVAVARDLSASLRADRALAGSEARWQAVIDSAVDAIVVIDSRGRIESFNSAAQRMFGYAASDVIGSNVSVLMPPAIAEEHDAYIRRYLETGEQRIIGIGREVSGRRKDGTLFPLHLSVGRAAIAGDIRFTGILRDLTERNVMEARLREESALARIGELAAVLAHEVKNPLAAISGAIQMLAHHIQAGSEEQDILKEVLQRIDGLSDLLTDLLLYARPPKPHPIAFDVRSLVESQVTFFKSDPAWRDVDVVVDADADISVLADPEQFKIVLQNVLVNAVQAMRHQGVLRIHAHRGPSAVSIDVVDAGTGMTADVQEKAFTPFFTTKARGTGLGLATVRRIAESQGGTAEIFRTGPTGTTVRIVFPPT